MDQVGTQEYTDDQRGRCLTCGFFGRVEMALGTWEEAPPNVRRQWWPIGGKLPSGHLKYFNPGCIVGAFDLEAEERAIAIRYVEAGKAAKEAGEPGPSLNPDAMVGPEIIAKDRECPKWFPYQPGMSPTEHVQRFHMLQLEEQRRAHEIHLAEIEASARRASEQIQTDSLEIAKATKATMDGLAEIAGRAEASDDKTDKFMRNWTRAAVAVGLIALVGFLIQYLFPGLGPEIGEWLTSLWPSTAP